MSLSSPEKIRELLDVIQSVSQELNLDKLLQLIMEHTSTIMSADRSTLFLVDRERGELWSKIAQGIDLQEIRVPLGQGIAGAVALTGETVNIPDAHADPRFNPDVDRRTGYRTRTILCLPVRDALGEIIAVVQVLNKRGGPFSREDEDLLRTFASQVAIAIRNAEQMTQIEERRRVSDLLRDVMKSFSSELGVDALLALIMERTAEVMQADRSTLFVVDRKRREIWSKVVQGAGMAEIRVPLGQGIAGTVAATAEVANIPDAYQDPRFDQSVDRRTGYRTRSILCAPVMDAQGEVIGVAQVLNKRDGVFTRDDESLLAALAGQAFIALENARLFETVLSMKNYNESILRCMATGVMTVDRDGLVATLNPAGERIFGRPAASAVGVAVREVLGPERNGSLVAQVEGCLARREAYDGYDLRVHLAERGPRGGQPERGAAPGQQGAAARHGGRRRGHHPGAAGDEHALPLRDAGDRRGGAQGSEGPAPGRHPAGGLDPVLRHPGLHDLQRATRPGGDRRVPERVLRGDDAGDLRGAGHARQVHRRRRDGGLRGADLPPRRSGPRGPRRAPDAAEPPGVQRAPGGAGEAADRDGHRDLPWRGAVRQHRDRAAHGVHRDRGLGQPGVTARDADEELPVQDSRQRRRLRAGEGRGPVRAHRGRARAGQEPAGQDLRDPGPATRARRRGPGRRSRQLLTGPGSGRPGSGAGAPVSDVFEAAGAGAERPAARRPAAPRVPKTSCHSTARAIWYHSARGTVR